jgi:hypothetical protein
MTLSPPVTTLTLTLPPPHDLHTRADAHKITIAQIIPAIPYMTALDSYTVWNSGLLTVLTLASGIEPAVAWLITVLSDELHPPSGHRDEGGGDPPSPSPSPLRQRDYGRGLRPRMGKLGEEPTVTDEAHAAFDALVLRVDTCAFYVLLAVWSLVQLNAVRWLVVKQHESFGAWLSACSPWRRRQAAPSNERLPDTAWMF